MQQGNSSVLKQSMVTMDIAHVCENTAEQNGLSHKKSLLKTLSPDAYAYVSQCIPLKSDKVVVINSCREKLKKPYSPVIGIVDVNPFSIQQQANQHIFSLNKSLKETGLYIGCSKVADIKSKSVLLSESWNMIKNVASHALPGLKRAKLLSKAEVLGRLVYGGFSIIEFKEIDGLLYFMVMKVRQAPNKKDGCTDNLIFPMERIGRQGKTMTVFKFRTMHPYSRFLQDYVVRMNGYNSVGKPANDFRLTPWGKLFRKYWIDELPQMVNFFKGDLSLVGVRPLSITRFKELPIEIQQHRIKFKPGCIPPYVSLNMPDSKGNIEAEKIYMEERMKNGFKTDIKYFFMALYNILSGKIKSA
jgi:lipopolysaccharide/colanic/teichoic acid biosynthesis glycosyltransferase